MSYLYATGRIRVLESHLLSEVTAERMLGAQDAFEAFRALSETDYAYILDKYPEPGQVEELIMEHLRDVRVSIQNMIGIKGPMQILWRKYDFHNLRSVIKSRVQESSVEELKKLLVPLGSRSRKAWLDFYEFGHKGGLRPEWLRVYDHALAVYDKSRDPHDIDILVDREYFEALRGMASKYGRFFNNYVQRLIDLYNITLRLRTSEDNKFNQHYEEGGFLSRRIFQSRKDLDQRIIGTGQGYAELAVGVKACLEENDYALFDKASDNLITDYLHQSRRIAFGPEPVFSYWLAKKNNAMIIRTIIISKLAGINQDHIRHRLRKVY